MKASRYSMVILLMVVALVAATLAQPVASPVKADPPDEHHEIWGFGSVVEPAEKLTSFGADTRHPSFPVTHYWVEGLPPEIFAVASNCSDNACTCIGDDYEIFLCCGEEGVLGDLILWQLTDNDADDRDPALMVLNPEDPLVGFVVYASNCSDNVCTSTADYELFILGFEQDEPNEPPEIYGPLQLTDNEADDIEPSLSFFPEEMDEPYLVVIAFSSTCSDNMCNTAGDDYEIYGSVLDFDTEIPALYPEWWQFTDNNADDRHPSLVLWETPNNGESELVATIAYSSTCSNSTCVSIDEYSNIYLMNAILEEPPDLEIAGNWNLIDILGGGEDGDTDLLEPALVMPFGCGEEVPNTVLSFTARCYEIGGCEEFLDFGESAIVTVGMDMDDEDPYNEPEPFLGGLLDVGFDDIESALCVLDEEFLDCEVLGAFASDYRYFSANCTAYPNPTKVDHEVDFDCTVGSVSDNVVCNEEDWYWEYLFYFGDGYYDDPGEGHTDHYYEDPGTYCPKVTVKWWCGYPWESGEIIGIETFFLDPVVVNPHLSVSCNATPNPTEVGVPVSLSANITGGVPPYNCLWWSAYGTVNSCNATYTFPPDAGNNDPTMILTVTDNLSNEETCVIDFWVYEAMEVTCNAEPNLVQLGSSVSFNCTATGGIPPYIYDLDFGDGSAHSTTCNTTYTYPEAGTFTAIVTVADNLTSRACSENITVYAPLEVVCGALPNPTKVGHEVQFTCTPSGGIPDYTYAWEFGDGIGTSDNQSPKYTYLHDESEPQTYTAVVTVTDNLTNAASCNVTMTVNPGLGVRCGASPSMATMGRQVEFSCTAMGGVSPYSYEWDFGDGASSTGQNPTHAYSYTGRYAAMVTVTDSLGNVVSCSTSVTVTTVGGRAGPGLPPPGSQPQLRPLHVELQYLRVTPQQTTAGQPVTVMTNVVNTGSEAGNYNVVLKINGQVEQTQMVSVGAYGTQPVKFTTTKAQPGTYTVNIGDQKANFIVTGAVRGPGSAMAEGILFAAATAVIALLVVLLVIVARRRSQGY